MAAAGKTGQGQKGTQEVKNVSDIRAGEQGVEKDMINGITHKVIRKTLVNWICS